MAARSALLLCTLGVAALSRAGAAQSMPELPSDADGSGSVETGVASDAVRQREMKTISNAAQFAVSEMQRREGGGNAVGDYSLVKVSHSEVADSGNGAQTLTLTLRIIKDGAYQDRSAIVTRHPSGPMTLDSFAAAGNGASTLPETAPGIVAAAQKAAASSGQALHPAVTAGSSFEAAEQSTASSGLVAQAAGAIASAERKLFRGGSAGVDTGGGAEA